MQEMDHFFLLNEFINLFFYWDFGLFFPIFLSKYKSE
jgi:hypothetical protein